MIGHFKETKESTERALNSQRWNNLEKRFLLYYALHIITSNLSLYFNFDVFCYTFFFNF